MCELLLDRRTNHGRHFIVLTPHTRTMLILPMVPDKVHTYVIYKLRMLRRLSFDVDVFW